MRLAVALMIAAVVRAGDPLRFVSFRDNGQPGVFIALSDDGYRQAAAAGVRHGRAHQPG
jgi:hypothetical protein